MADIGWIIAFVGAGILFGIVGVWRILRGKKTEHKPQEKRNSSQGLMTLAGSFLVLGIALGTATDRLVGYSFIGTAVLLSIVGAIKSRKREQGSSMER